MLPWFSGLNASHHLLPEPETSIKYWSVLLGFEWSQWWLSWGELYRNINILYSWWFLRFLIEKIESQSGFRDGKHGKFNQHSLMKTHRLMFWSGNVWTWQFNCTNLCTTLQLTGPIRKQRGSQILTMSTLAPTWVKRSNLLKTSPIQRGPNNLYSDGFFLIS